MSKTEEGRGKEGRDEGQRARKAKQGEADLRRCGLGVRTRGFHGYTGHFVCLCVYSTREVPQL